MLNESGMSGEERLPGHEPDARSMKCISNTASNRCRFQDPQLLQIPDSLMCSVKGRIAALAPQTGHRMVSMLLLSSSEHRSEKAKG
jgi:hypothetical protein